MPNDTRTLCAQAIQTDAGTSWGDSMLCDRVLLIFPESMVNCQGKV